MSDGDVVGTVGGLWRFPVKSMLGEELDEVEIAPGGIVGDRALGLIDRESGELVSATRAKVWPDLLRCRATFTEPPRSDHELPAVRIDLADGTSVMSDAADVDAVLSAFFGREVELARADPQGFAIDEYHPDPQGDMPGPVPEGSFFDLFPMSVITTSTLEHLGDLEPQTTFDVRRFRMNVIVAMPKDGFAENAWIGRALHLGETVALGVAAPDPRCAVTTVAQEGLERDPGILKAIGRHNRIAFRGAGLYPCAGVYAVVASGGVVRTGDPVTLA